MRFAYFARQHWIEGVSLIALLVVFFFIYSTLSSHSLYNGTPLFNSPDETANYFFSKQFARTGSLGFAEPLLEASNGYIHPRSMTAVGERVVPVGFLGLPVLYGFLAKIFGVHAIPYFTPALASIAALFFYILIRNVFSPRIGALAMILLLIHPAYMYNANRAMLPNVAFVSFLIIACALCSYTYQLRRRSAQIGVGFLSGAALGMSLWIRFSEAPWVFGLLGVFALAAFRKIRIFFAISFLVGLSFPLVLMGWYNANTYGNPLLFGYQTAVIPQAVYQLEQSGTLLQSLASGNAVQFREQAVLLLKAVKHALLPFGIQKELFVKIFWDYGVSFFLPFSILAIFGFFFALRHAFRAIRKRSVTPLAVTLCTLGMSAWLVVFYGSWIFYDNLDREITIGASYLRYWLPLFIFTLPWGAMMISFLSLRAKGVVAKIALTSLICSLALFSFHQVFMGSSESVDGMRASLQSYNTKRKFIEGLTPADAVVVSARSDKIFFPVRKVAEQTSDFREVVLMKNVLVHAPIYYYGLWSQRDAASISKKYFEPHGMRLEFIVDADEKEHLYRMVGK